MSDGKHAVHAFFFAPDSFNGWIPLDKSANIEPLLPMYEKKSKGLSPILNNISENSMADDVTDMVYQLEGLDYLLKQVEQQNENLVEWLSRNEKENRYLNEVLEFFKSKQNDGGFKVFQIMLGVNEYDVEWPDQFYQIFLDDKLFSKIIGYTYHVTRKNLQTTNLALCVILRIFRSIEDDEKYRTIISKIVKQYDIFELILGLVTALSKNKTRLSGDVANIVLILVTLMLQIIARNKVAFHPSIQSVKNLLQTVETFDFDEEICELGFSLLKYFIEEYREIAAGMFEEKSYEKIFNITSKHKEDESVTSAGGAILHELCKCGDTSFTNQESSLRLQKNIDFFADRFIDFFIIAVEEEWPNILPIINVIVFLTTSKIFIRGRAESLTEVLVNCLEQYENSADIQTARMKCKTNLRRIEENNGIKYKGKNENSGSTDAQWLTEIFSVMGAHLDNAQVQEAACRSIADHISINPSICNMIGEENEHLLSLHNNVVLALNIYTKDIYVCQAACCAIHELAMNSRIIQQYLIVKGVYVTIIREMKNALNDRDLHLSGYHALRALAHQNPYQEELMFKYDVLSLIERDLHNFVDSRLLQEALCLLTCLSTDLEIARRQCILSSLPQTILKIINDYAADEDLVQIGLEAISESQYPLLIEEKSFDILSTLVFSASEENQIRKLETIETIQRALSANSVNSQIQQKGCIIMQMMAADVSFTSELLVAIRIVELITEAITRGDQGDSDVLVEGCVALSLVLENETSANIDMFEIKDMTIDSKLVEVLFEIIQYFGSHDDVFQIAQQCLAYLCTELKVANKALIRACLSGYVTCAKLALAFGANIDTQSSEMGSPICIATINGNLNLVKYLLSCSPADTTTALSIAMNIEHFNIAGEILRHLGYEKQNGSISWSAMNISVFNADLLFPTLLSHQSNKDSDTNTVTPFFQRRKRAASFINEEDQEQQIDDARKSPSRTRSTSFTSTVKEFDRGRKIETVSGILLPYNTLDPRLERRGSDQKHIIIPSPVEGLNYPGHPDIALSPDPDFGKLVSPDKCIDTIENFRKAFSDGNMLNKADRIRCNSALAKTSTPPAKVKENEKHRTKSCLAKFLETSYTIVEYMDVSHNQIGDLSSLAGCPSPYISQFLSRLKHLDLSHNRIIKLPSALCSSLRNLKSLALSNNGLQEFPDAIFTHQILETLDLSGNQLGNLAPQPAQLSNSLLKLDLSNNGITIFPNWINEAFPCLNRLFLSENQTETIPEMTRGFHGLQELSLKYNRLHSLPETFLSECFGLEKVDFSYNQLATLPKYNPSTLSRLTTIRITHNHLSGEKPFFIPRVILSIPSLQYIDLSHNQISGFPDPSHWASKGIRQVLFCNNQIKEVNLNSNVGITWPLLSRLDLSHNKIEQLGKDIGHLTSLSSLNVSHNPLKHLPDEIGRLTRLYEFPLDGLHLSLDPAILKGTPQDVISFFSSKLKKAVPYRRIKLMLVGDADRGKTSLIRQLRSKKHPPYHTITVGVEVKNWMLKPSSLFSNSKPVIMNTWDFAGQEDFYSTHQYFLTSRALYLAVYDASKGIKEIETLQKWLVNIKAAAPDSVVILVGTHADRIESKNRNEYVTELFGHIDKCFRGPGYPTIRARAIVNCMKENKGIEKLRNRIFEVISGFKYEGESVIDQMVPESYLDLEDLIRKEARKLSTNNMLPITTKQYLWKSTVDSGIHLNKEEFTAALKFLKETGSIMHFQDPKHNLSSLYFIDPQWLCKMMARVVTVKEINPYITPQGILTTEDALKLFPRDVYPDNFLDRYFRLLRKFEILLPISEKKYLVTSKLPKDIPQYVPVLQDKFENSNRVTRRTYVFPYIPNGLWVRLITRTIIFADLTDESEKKKYITCDYWQSGMYMKWNEQTFFLITEKPTNKKCLEIFTPISPAGYKILGCLVDLVDNLLEEWYPGLQLNSSKNGSSVQRLSPCYVCQRHYFQLEDIISESYQSESMNCENCGLVLIQAVAPDVVFADIDRELVLEECQISFQDIDSKTLGVGAFAYVYQAQVNGINLALKVFRNPGGNGTCPNRLLRQEVDILTKLHHPCLISLVGVSLRPRMLLLEYAPLGNLDAVLNSRRGLSRGMQHRIALQIAEGLSYLHSFNIVYRDLKPSNILVFSLSMGVLINVKISDYGISQYAGVMGLNAPVGTPGHQAPEVTQGDSEYNLEVDIFSYGVTLYEIITGGKHPYGQIPCQSELDAAVLANKPFENITKHGCSSWPDMEFLIAQCLSAKPDDRPRIAEVCSVLTNAELLSLKSELTICKNQSVECMCIAEVLEESETKHELWIGSGESGSNSQLSWVTLGSRREIVRGLMVTEGRILCIEVMDKHVVVGTKEGCILMYHCNTKKRQSQFPKLPDSVLCMKYVRRLDVLLVGLANGSLYVYRRDDLLKGDIYATEYKFSVSGEHMISPITCLTQTGDSVLCGYGNYVMQIHLNTYKVARYAPACNRNIVSTVLFCRNKLYIACKESSTVQVWNYNDLTKRKIEIDCFELIRQQVSSVQKRDCRVVSMVIPDREVLWVGCGNGCILLVDITNEGYARLALVQRHTTAVRALIISPPSPGKSPSVISGALGFSHISKLGKDTDNFACVFVWESDLAKQKKHQECELKKRLELLED